MTHLRKIDDLKQWQKAKSAFQFTKRSTNTKIGDKMITKSKEVTSIKYVIGLKDKALLDIIYRDNDAEEADQQLWETIGLIDGVQDVDYDGHFGNYIYIEVDKEHDTEATWKSIYDLINSYTSGYK